MKQLVSGLLRDFDPDAVDLAAPLVLGAAGVAAAARQGVPAVAVFQTDIVGFASRYRLSSASPLIGRWLRRVHNSAAVTLPRAP